MTGILKWSPPSTNNPMDDIRSMAYTVMGWDLARRSPLTRRYSGNSAQRRKQARALARKDMETWQ